MAGWQYESTDDFSLYILYGEGQYGSFSYQSTDGNFLLHVHDTGTDFFTYELTADFQNFTPVIPANGAIVDPHYSAFHLSVVGDIPSYAFTPDTFAMPVPVEGDGQLDMQLFDAYYNGRFGGVTDLNVDLNFTAYLPQIDTTQIYFSGELTRVANPEASSILLLVAALSLFSWKQIRQAILSR